MLLLPRVPLLVSFFLALSPYPFPIRRGIRDFPQHPRYHAREHSWLKIGENRGKRRCVSMWYVTSGIQEPIRYRSSLSLSLVCEFQRRQQSIYGISHFASVYTHSKLVVAGKSAYTASWPWHARSLHEFSDTLRYCGHGCSSFNQRDTRSRAAWGGSGTHVLHPLWINSRNAEEFIAGRWLRAGQLHDLRYRSNVNGRKGEVRIRFGVH